MWPIISNSVPIHPNSSVSSWWISHTWCFPRVPIFPRSPTVSFQPSTCYQLFIKALGRWGKTEAHIHIVYKKIIPIWENKAEKKRFKTFGQWTNSFWGFHLDRVDRVSHCIQMFAMLLEVCHTHWRDQMCIKMCAWHLYAAEFSAVGRHMLEISVAFCLMKV